MTTQKNSLLIANIGTSDLTVQIPSISDYLPVGFARDEPNLTKTVRDLSETRQTNWNQRQKLICETICSELEVPFDDRYRFSFRELTHHLFLAYENNPKLWSNRIRPGRFWGIAKTAVEHFKVERIYCFVTDQTPPHRDDTIYLFEILKKWLEETLTNCPKIEKVVIPKEVSAVDQDALFDVYYRFLNRECDRHLTTLISIKGGTPQMQTALRVQTISSQIETQIYLEPELQARLILEGEPSPCRRVSYWRYQRTMKYQTVKQLLQRWDFDGARVVLSDWKETLATLETSQTENREALNASRELVDVNVRALGTAVALMNLDIRGAKQEHDNRLDSISELANQYSYPQNSLYRLLNLHTQCCILWELDRIAEFLIRIGLFYEEIIHDLVRQLDPKNGHFYFNRVKHPDDWYLKTDEVVKNPELAHWFYQLESGMGKSSLVGNIKKQNCLVNESWQKPLRGLFKLPGRHTKRNFLQALIELQRDVTQEKAAGKMIASMQALDYWCVKRNQIIHGAKGISKSRLMEVLQEDRQLGCRQQSMNADIQATIGVACQPDEICDRMTQIITSAFAVVNSALPEPSLVALPEGNTIASVSEPFYLYSDIREWVSDRLDRDVQ
ncbi:hypothetical protein [Sodalinema gerasimenkoae]|uniref:hypothetical protein n=1 Tax=Sodalinema gerasimenkoae TaxID=2862348 RepID=UPI0013576129|nr:hypothetical protein [Sodalinema gerasimenkoae]